MLRARSLVSLLMYALAAGLIVAAAAFPVVSIAGLATKAASDHFAAMPDVLHTSPSAQTTSVYASDGKTLITSFYDENRRDVPLPTVAPVMRQAMVDAEDARFYEHGAVDLKSVLRALASNAGSGQVKQGASTLTMQYVRNVLKSDPSLTEQQRADATVDTPARKIQEARYAITLEQTLSKDQILERYLNIAYFGDGAYGIFAASQTYFNRPPAELTLPQAALLAGLVQSPDSYNPAGGDATAALGRRSYVLDSMVKAGHVTEPQAAAAKAQPLALSLHEQPNNCAAVSGKHNDWGFFCDYFRTWWEAQPQFGTTVADRDRALHDGGYTVVTSLDPTIQASALAQSLKVYGYDNARSLPMAVVTPGTGRILAMAVNRHYSLAPNPASHPKYPNTVNQLIAGGNGASGYQAGSTFKMFTMLAALEAGKSLDTGFDAPTTIKTTFPGNSPGCGGFWCPSNETASWMDGYRTMWNAFGRSVNTYFVWLEEQVGPEKAVAVAQKLGITFRSNLDKEQAKRASGWGAFTLGVAATTPLDLANAYATVAANGMYCSPLPVKSIVDLSGRALPVANPTCRRALAPDVAAAAADAARCPVGGQSTYGRCDGGTATMVSGILNGRPVGGKTGSSEENSTETFVGFTAQVAAAGIAVNVDNPHDNVGSAVSASVDQAVARTMATALAGQPVRPFPVPSRDIAYGADGPGPIGGPTPTPSPGPGGGRRPTPGPRPSPSP